MENCRVHVSSISPCSTVGGKGGGKGGREEGRGGGAGGSEPGDGLGWVQRRRAGDEKRFDEKMDRGCEG